MAFYHFLPPPTAQMGYYYWVSFFIVSLGLKVNVRVVLIVMIIGSHREEEMSTWYMSGIVLSAIQALPQILQPRNVKDGHIVENKLKCT